MTGGCTSPVDRNRSLPTRPLREEGASGLAEESTEPEWGRGVCQQAVREVRVDEWTRGLWHKHRL